MPKSNDGPKKSTPKINRRTVISSALVAGGLTALARGVPLPQANAGGNRAFVAEREWARTLARHVSNQLQEAAQLLPDLCLSSDQLEQLRRAFENTLVTNMGCEVPPPTDQ
jgi:hypothetical protein